MTVAQPVAVAPPAMPAEQPPLQPAPVEPPAMKPRLSAGSRGLLFLAPFALIGLVGFGGVWAMSWLPSEPAPPYGSEGERYLALSNPHRTPDAEPDGRRLYEEHCAKCHGVNGDRKQATALDVPAPLVPEPRYIGGEGFKFTDTASGSKEFRDAAKTLGGTPTDDRLLRLLRRGIPGSAMPSFDQLPEATLRAIVGYVRERFITPERVLVRFGRAKELYAEGTGDEWNPKTDWSEAKRMPYREQAAADVYGSQAVRVPAELTPAAGFEARAAVLFEKNCSGCHGKDGHGVIDPKYRNDNGTQAYPRNFSLGLFKGGAEPADLYRRVYLGIPGTPMKAFGKELKESEIVDLIHYVKRFATTP